MATKYLQGDIIDQVRRVTENVDYFSLLCTLSKSKTSQEVNRLFTAPVDSFRININYIISKNAVHFCALFLSILFQDGFEIDWQNLKLISVVIKNKLKDIVKEFGIDLSTEMSRNSLQTGFDTLNGTYVKQRKTRYIFIHDKICNIVPVICGKKITEYFIKYATEIFIKIISLMNQSQQ